MTERVDVGIAHRFTAACAIVLCIPLLRACRGSYYTLVPIVTERGENRVLRIHGSGSIDRYAFDFKTVSRHRAVACKLQFESVAIDNNLARGQLVVGIFADKITAAVVDVKEIVVTLKLRVGIENKLNALRTGIAERIFVCRIV